MAEEFDPLGALISELSGGSDTDKQLANMAKIASAQLGYKDKELQAGMERLRISEEGANTRAGISASASRYAASTSAAASRANAQTAASTAKRGQDIQKQIAEMENASRLELGRGQLGLQALELPTKYRGPEDYFQQSDLLRGMAARQDVPVFVRSLLDNGTLAGYQMPGGAPSGFNLQGVLNKIGGGGGGIQGQSLGGPTGQNASALASIRELGQRGLHTLAAGSLERLTPSELGTLRSGLEYSGDGGPAWNWDDLYQGYKNAYIGQGNPRAA